MKAEELNLIYSKIGGCLRNEDSDYAIRVVFDLMEAYANQKVLEALEEEFSILPWVDGTELSQSGGNYYKTEVEPKYKI